MASLGEELRKQREIRQISLREISDVTKINLRFLEAIERDDFTHLPGGQFNKGFIRAYCRMIGVDPESMIDAYDAQVRQSPETPALPEPQKPHGLNPVSAALWSIGALCLLVIAMGSWIAWHSLGASRAPATANGGAVAAQAPGSAPAPSPESAFSAMHLEMALDGKLPASVLCDGAPLAAATGVHDCREEIIVRFDDPAAAVLRIRTRPGGSPLEPPARTRRARRSIAPPLPTPPRGEAGPTASPTPGAQAVPAANQPGTSPSSPVKGERGGPPPRRN